QRKAAVARAEAGTARALAACESRCGGAEGSGCPAQLSDHAGGPRATGRDGVEALQREPRRAALVLRGARRHAARCARKAPARPGARARGREVGGHLKKMALVTRAAVPTGRRKKEDHGTVS